MPVAQFWLQILYDADTQVLAPDLLISPGQVWGAGHSSFRKHPKGVYYAAVAENRCFEFFFRIPPSDLEIRLCLDNTRSRLMESEPSWEILRLSDYEPLETLAFGVANEITERMQPAAFSTFSNDQSPWTTLEYGLRTLSWDQQVEQLNLMFLTPGWSNSHKSNSRGRLYEAGIVIT